MEEKKEIKYDNRVLIGNWFEASRLQEDKLNIFLDQMKTGKLLLAKVRIMHQNLMSATTLTQSPASIWFGAKINIFAPLMPVNREKKGMVMAGFISEQQIDHTQDLEDGCALSAQMYEGPVQGNTFIISSADMCDRDNELLKYNQDFTLILSSSKSKKPLYVRFDLDAIPGISTHYPVYLSKHPVTNTRWRVLPLQKPSMTRFEQEDQPVPVNQSVIINHSATNVNLGINMDFSSQGFFTKENSLLVKNYLDIYKNETAQNIWEIHTEIPKHNEGISAK